jgi:Flp pilus assembly protein TadG
MRDSRQGGQAVIELALVLPVLLIYALGILAVGEIVREYTAVRAAATQAAFAAARAPSLVEARQAGGVAAHEAVAGAPVQDFVIQVDAGTFARGGVVTTMAAGYVDLGAFPAAEAFLGRRFHLEWRAHALIEPYRSRRP